MNAHAVRVRTHASGYEIESRRGLSLGERVAAFLRQRHPTKTADNVAADTGIPVNTVKTWLQRCSSPDADGYTLLWLAYGPEFLAVLADGRAPQWLLAARREHEAALLKAEIEALKLKLAKVR
jgi:hypothetical protein